MQSEIRSLQEDEKVDDDLPKIESKITVEGVANNESDNDSDEEIIEKSKKYLTDEAGIIIVKQRKIPKQKFDIRLNFDMENNLQGEKQLKYKIDNIDGLSFVDEQHHAKAEDANAQDYTWKALTSIKDGQASIIVQNDYGKLDADRVKKHSIASQIQHMDAISSVVNDAGRKQNVIEKEEVYRQNFGGHAIDSASLPLLSALLSNDDVGDEEFEEETIEDGKLVLYLTEKQLAQLLKQRAIIVTKKNKKILVKENKPGPAAAYHANRSQYTASNIQSQVIQSNVAAAASSANTYEYHGNQVADSYMIQSEIKPVKIEIKSNENQSHLSHLSNKAAYENYIAAPINAAFDNVQQATHAPANYVQQSHVDIIQEPVRVVERNDYLTQVIPQLPSSNVDYNPPLQNVSYDYVEQSYAEKVQEPVSYIPQAISQLPATTVDYSPLLPSVSLDYVQQRYADKIQEPISYISQVVSQLPTATVDYSSPSASVSHAIESYLYKKKESMKEESLQPQDVSRKVWSENLGIVNEFVTSLKTNVEESQIKWDSVAKSYEQNPSKANVIPVVKEFVNQYKTNVAHLPLVQNFEIKNDHDRAFAEVEKLVNKLKSDGTSVAQIKVETVFEPVSDVVEIVNYRISQDDHDKLYALDEFAKGLVKENKKWLQVNIEAIDKHDNPNGDVKRYQIVNDFSGASGLVEELLEKFKIGSESWSDIKGFVRYGAESAVVQQPQQVNIYEVGNADSDGMKVLDNLVESIGTNSRKWSEVHLEVVYADESSSQVEKKEIEKLKQVDQFVIRLKNEQTAPVNHFHAREDKRAIEALDAFAAKLRTILDAWYIEKTRVREQPPRIVYQDRVVVQEKIQPAVVQQKIQPVVQEKIVHVPAAKKPQQVQKKSVKFTYLDNYQPATRIYTLEDDYDLNELKAGDKFGKTSDYISYYDFNASTDIDQYFSAPFTRKINENTVVINQGLANKDFVQIHPLLTNQTEIKKVNEADASADATLPKVIRPVMLGSDNYEKYYEEVAKHFGGLRIIDFPVYVQGLELKQQISSDSSSFVKKSESTIRSVNLDDWNMGHHSEHMLQTAQNSENLHFIRVNQ